MDSEKYVMIEPQFNVPMILLAVIVCCLASYAAIHLTNRKGQTGFLHEKAWHMMGAIIMSLGIWSMHYIGMMSVEIRHKMDINMLTTMMSIIPPIITSYIVFYIASQHRRTKGAVLLSSMLMVLGIVTMHYIGMSAMHYHHMKITYDFTVIFVSIVLAIIICYQAIVRMFKQTSTYVYVHELMAAILFAFATAVIHYLGIWSMDFYLERSVLVSQMQQATTMNEISLGLFVCIVLFTVIFIGSRIIDGYAGRRMKTLDSLTQLPNRYAFTTRLQNDEYVKSVALLTLCDIQTVHHEFSFIEEDEMIRMIVSELQHGRPMFTELYRVRDFSFVFIMKDAQAVNDSLSYFDKKLARIKSILTIEEHGFAGNAGICIDIATDLATIQEIYMNTLTTEQHPTTEFKFAITQYKEGYHAKSFREQLLQQVSQAMNNNELFVVYQPKVDLDREEIHSVEALIRWNHKELGFLSPAVFLPILEANNRMNEVTNWIIQKVCKELASWGHMEHMPQRVAINIPGPYLASPILKAQLLQCVEQYQLIPEQIELEITETSFVSSIEEAKLAIDDLRAHGFHIAIDDFGIGASSLAYLKDLKFTTLKVDRSFVQHIPYSATDNSILQSIISLAQSLHLQIVIEGVEDAQQLAYLQSIAKELIIQGFYFTKPLTSDELARWCIQYKKRTKSSASSDQYHI
ncbi:sensor domain-containing diguanylate cyclase [Caryophanon tenue]|uniref:EAL domain-containing protein n=1 Tax=Caryophanon tenue TaxID=33978 RepID=A0A1C0YIV5_9BACL|nr:EAL domain-containing protein [Caryophanon tenue]OCS87106.1 hypothetical protein A6M13_11565 [Caryophanon tenue]